MCFKGEGKIAEEKVRGESDKGRETGSRAGGEGRCEGNEEFNDDTLEEAATSEGGFSGGGEVVRRGEEHE